MTDYPETSQHDSLTRAIAIIALILSLLAAIWGYQGAKRSREALDRANQTVNNQADTDGAEDNLMRGTQQEPVLPPTEPPTQ